MLTFLSLIKHNRRTHSDTVHRFPSTARINMGSFYFTLSLQSSLKWQSLFWHLVSVLQCSQCDSFKIKADIIQILIALWVGNLELMGTSNFTRGPPHLLVSLWQCNIAGLLLNVLKVYFCLHLQTFCGSTMYNWGEGNIKLKQCFFKTIKVWYRYLLGNCDNFSHHRFFSSRLIKSKFP